MSRSSNQSHNQYKLCSITKYFKRLRLCSYSVLHLLHQPWRAAGEQTGAGGLRAHCAGGHDPISDQLLCAGVKGQAGAAGRSPSTGH